MAAVSPLPDEHFLAMIDGAVIGALGGVINSIRNKTIKDWGQTLATILTAGFTGMLAQLVAGWLDMDMRFQFALSGVAGYSGGILLDDVVKRLRGIINSTGDVIEEVGKISKELKEKSKGIN